MLTCPNRAIAQQAVNRGPQADRWGDCTVSCHLYPLRSALSHPKNFPWIQSNAFHLFMQIHVCRAGGPVDPPLCCVLAHRPSHAVVVATCTFPHVFLAIATIPTFACPAVCCIHCVFPRMKYGQTLQQRSIPAWSHRQYQQYLLPPVPTIT